MRGVRENSINEREDFLIDKTEVFAIEFDNEYPID